MGLKNIENNKSKVETSEKIEVSVVPKGGCLATEEETSKDVICEGVKMSATLVSGTLTTVNKKPNENE